MKILATFDANDYQDTVDVYERYSVRGIIMRDGMLATQCDRDGSYKLPGGGPEAGEAFREALAREVREETGLRVIEGEITELGEILEIRKDLFDAAKKYICHSLFYFCRVGTEAEEPCLTASERERGYQFRWTMPEEICRENTRPGREPWIVRDAAFVQMIIDKRVILPDDAEG